MTRRDYILIAEALHQALHNTHTDECGPQAGVLESAHQLATSLKRDNPRFDRDHFLAVVRGEKDVDSHPARNSRHGQLRGAA